MAIDPTQVSRFAHGSRVPGWDEAADLTKDGSRMCTRAGFEEPSARMKQASSPRGDSIG